LRNEFDIDNSARHQLQVEFGAGALFLFDQDTHFRRLAGGTPRVTRHSQCRADGRSRIIAKRRIAPDRPRPRKRHMLPRLGLVHLILDKAA
jgi:hypothetical protein